MTGPDIDARWLSSCLGQGANNLRGVSWSPVGTGQVAASYRGELDWAKAGAPETIVVKCPSENEQSRATGFHYGLYEKEVAWYRELRQQSEINCPKCYGTHFDQEKSEFFLVLEDCSPARQGDQLAGASVDEVRAGVIELACLHAAFFDDDRINQNPATALTPEDIQLRSGLFLQFWTPFRERYATRLHGALLEMGDRLVARYDQFDTRPLKHFSLVHGDFRLDNLLFRDGARPFVLDWQTLVAGCPMKDVAYFIGTSFASPDDRRTHEDALLQTYFAKLRELGVQADEDALIRDYRIEALTGLTMAVVSSMLVERTERGDEMFALMAERPGYQALELDSVSLF